MKSLYRLFDYFWKLALALFTVYVLLDTFAIPRTYKLAVRQSFGDHFTGTAVLKTIDFLNSSFHDNYEIIGEYEDDNCAILLKKYHEYDSNIYVAEVSVANVSYLQSVFAHDIYGKNITDTTSNIAREAGAILAVNGDFYGAQENGYVIRNGVLYRDVPDLNGTDLILYYDGTMGVAAEKDVTAQELLDSGAWQVYSFGPELIGYGTGVSDDFSRSGYAIESYNPRTAIGYIEPFHYMLVTADGRSKGNMGLTFDQLAEFMELIGCKLAYNLDGGGSATMVFQGELVNSPSDGKERSVSDIVSIISQ